MRASHVAALAALLAALVAACGGATRGARGVRDGARVEGRAGDASYALLARPLGDRVHLLLAVDAGTRDATPPPVATLAAWVAAGRAHVDGFAAPDLVGLSTTCTRDALDACVTRLYHGLAARGVREDELRDARARLREARARAAGDDARRADALALAGALGGTGATEALGRAEDDSRLDAHAVDAFLASHFGPSRARLFVVGAVDEAALAHAVDVASAGAPRATAVRADRRACGAGDEARAEWGTEGADAADPNGSLSAALCVTDRGLAQAVGRAAGHADVVPLRGGALVLLRDEGDGADYAARARSLVARLEVARLEARPDATDAALPDAPREAARMDAARWAAGDAHDGTDARVSLGVVGPAPRDAAPGTAALLAQARSALTEGVADAAPRMEGTLGAAASSAVARSGARIETRRADGDAALALRFAGGSADEPRGAHGRTAVVAELLADGCARDGADVTPFVDPRSFGVDARAADPATLDRVLACALSLEPDAPAVARAAAVLVAGEADDDVRLRASAARLVAPESPGAVAPHGDPQVPPELTRDDVAAVLAGARVGARTSIAVVSPEPADESARHLARRAARLVPGALAPDDALSGPAATDLLAAASRDGAAHVVLAWRTDAAPAGTTDDDVEAVADALAHALDARPGLHVRGVVAGAVQSLAWLAAALDVDDDALDALPATWAAATASLDADALRRSRDESRAVAAALRGTSSGLASSLAAARLAAHTARLVDPVALAHAVFASPPRAEIAASPPAHPRVARPLVLPPRPPHARRPRRRVPHR